VNSLKIAWLLPSLARGDYWVPIFKEFIKLYPNTLIFTGNVSQNIFKSLKGKIIFEGKTRFLILKRNSSKVFILPSLKIFLPLFRFSPNLIFTSGFSLWTLIIVFCKIFFNWKIVVVYDGSSPSVDRIKNKVFVYYRKIVSFFVDGFITNTFSGKKMLINILNQPENKIFVFAYEVPSENVFLRNENIIKNINKLKNINRPIFLYVGRIIKKKGIEQLIHVAYLLKVQKPPTQLLIQ